MFIASLGLLPEAPTVITTVTSIDETEPGLGRKRRRFGRLDDDALHENSEILATAALRGLSSSELERRGARLQINGNA